MRNSLFLLAVALLAATIIYLVLYDPAHAHDSWSDGKTVPSWVKSSCCGEADAHHLTPDQVHRISDEYYEVDGYQRRIPVAQALPSQDGDYWIFYRQDQAGMSCSPFGGCAPTSASQSGVYCFFVPMDF